MQLVWLSHFIPYPPHGGSRQRSFNLIRFISKTYQVHLFALNLQREMADRVAEYKKELNQYCTEVEIWEPPFPWRGVRWWAQLALSPFYRKHYGAHALWSPEVDRRWRLVLEKHPGALLHFDSIDLAGYVAAAAGFRKVLNHHNCESAMAYRRAERESNPLKKAYLWSQARKLERLEREMCAAFDMNLAVSDVDAEILRSRCPSGHFHIVENGTDTDYFHPSDAEPEPNTLVFAGSLDWYPNISGLRFFVRETWPLLKEKSPGIRLYVAGRSPVPEIVRLAKSDPAIELIADPPDIRPWVWRASVFICPIIDGGGTRLKILDALAMGKAVVSTPTGCEGLRFQGGGPVLVSNQRVEFISQTLHALNDKALRRDLGLRGRALAQAVYGWTAIAGQLSEAYEQAALCQANTAPNGRTASGASAPGLR